MDASVCANKRKFLITSTAFMVTLISKWVVPTFVYSEVIFSKGNQCAIFLNNIFLLGHMSIQNFIFLLPQDLQQPK